MIAAIGVTIGCVWAAWDEECNAPFIAGMFCGAWVVAIASIFT